MAKTKAKGLWIGPSETAYAFDPSTSGALYLWLPVISASISELKDKKAPLPTEYATGRNFRTAPIEGPDGWEMSFRVPLIGCATAAMAGTDADTITDDWLDRILWHLCGSRYTTTGESLANAPQATQLEVAAGDPYAEQELTVVHQPGRPTRTRSQWNRVIRRASAQVYDITPGWADFATAPPTASASARGVKGYVPISEGGPTLPFVYRQDDVDYTLLGGRCTSASISSVAGKIVEMSLTFRGDTKIRESKASLPAARSAPVHTPVRGINAPVWFGGTQVATKSVTIDLGIEAQEIMSTAGQNGRQDDRMGAMNPTVRIEPLFDTGLEDLKRVPTAQPVMVQLGGGPGAVAGQPLNTLCFDAPAASIVEADPTDDSGRVRQAVTLEVNDPVTLISTAARVFQIARAA